MKIDDKSVIKSAYFANWADIFGFPIARALLPFALKFSFLTPNIVTCIAFVVYSLGCIFLFLPIPFHLPLAAVLLFLGYIGDDLDGQIARAKRLSSVFGDYLDKVLDVLKIYLITLSLGISVYIKTNEIIYVFLAFTACFFFTYRYYIKLETLFSKMSRDEKYLQESQQARNIRQEYITKELISLSYSPIAALKKLWIQHRLFFLVDEAEFVIITAVGALINTLEWSLIFIAFAQITIAFWRLIERGYQLHTDSLRLLWPMRK